MTSKFKRASLVFVTLFNLLIFGSMLYVTKNSYSDLEYAVAHAESRAQYQYMLTWLPRGAKAMPFAWTDSSIVRFIEEQYTTSDDNVTYFLARNDADYPIIWSRRSSIFRGVTTNLRTLLTYTADADSILSRQDLASVWYEIQNIRESKGNVFQIHGVHNIRYLYNAGWVFIPEPSKSQAKYVLVAFKPKNPDSVINVYQDQYFILYVIVIGATLIFLTTLPKFLHSLRD